MLRLAACSTSALTQEWGWLAGSVATVEYAGTARFFYLRVFCFIEDLLQSNVPQTGGARVLALVLQ
jgi:hypothetical protein